MKPAGICTSDFGQFSMVNIFVVSRFFSSTDGSIFNRGFTSVRPAVSAFMPNVHARGGGGGGGGVG